MITKITGILATVRDDALSLRVGELEYEILIPDFTRRHVQGKLGETVSLFTLHYLEGNPAGGKLIPRLVGFTNEAEREFFELFCSVDGVGVKKALRAMVRPVREVAIAIEEQDDKGLTALPGVGPAVADRIIAKLRRKMPKFALIVDKSSPREADVALPVLDEAFAVLKQLGHSDAESRKLVDLATSEKKSFKDVQSLLQVVYKKRLEVGA
ncbi:MAG: helix-hairpin-helix domain-containing protein [Pirellulales bacterium]|nr:helix-hairpin-helix domain-containing protein [Pirellulales bacterium]